LFELHFKGAVLLGAAVLTTLYLFLKNKPHRFKKTLSPTEKILTRKTSQKGLDLIRSYEGYSASVYQCSAGKHTIGYGHVLVKGETFSKIDKVQAELLLLRDIANAEEAINQFVTTNLNQNRFDSLVSLVFNIGIDAFRQSTLLTKLNNGLFNEIPEQFIRWIYITKGGKKKVSTGLKNRRTAEVELWNAKA
jgi:lysozyme